MEERPPRLKTGDGAELVEHLFRHQSGVVIATLIRLLGAHNLDLAEEVAQDALVRALEIWPYAGIPQNPCAWLIQTARNKATDLLRRRASFAARGTEVAAATEPSNDSDAEATLATRMMSDDVITMLFMCCHPSLPAEGRVALALRAVAGLSTAEIARAFLAQESTVAQRIVRAKRVIREHGIAFELPAMSELPERLQSVLEVLYCWFNEGYLPSGGPELIRRELCHEAIRVGELLIDCSTTDRPECHALLALMHLQAARFPARMNGEGEMLLLRDQDRSRWDPRLLALGFKHLERSAEGDEITAYHVEAGIAACHATATTYAVTDWRRIVELYEQLLVLKPTPVIALNHAVALSRVAGPHVAIERIAAIAMEPTLENYHLLHAVLGELWTEAGDAAAGHREYELALRRDCSEPERRFLEKKLSSRAR